METPQAYDLLRRFFELEYIRHKHDSPEKSRVSLVGRATDILNGEIPGSRILDIGSGPQSLESQLLATGNRETRSLLGRYSFFTLDFARILKNRLLATKSENVSHLQANAIKLPFAEGTFGLIVSNHAIDIMPREAFPEAYRVLAKNGRAIFYFHHSDLIPEDLHTIKDLDIRRFWEYLKQNKMLFENEKQISDYLASVGFTIGEIKLADDGFDKWWEVVCSKS